MRKIYLFRLSKRERTVPQFRFDMPQRTHPKDLFIPIFSFFHYTLTPSIVRLIYELIMFQVYLAFYQKYDIVNKEQKKGEPDLPLLLLKGILLDLSKSDPLASNDAQILVLSRYNFLDTVLTFNERERAGLAWHQLGHRSISLVNQSHIVWISVERLTESLG